MGFEILSRFQLCSRSVLIFLKIEAKSEFGSQSSWTCRVTVGYVSRLQEHHSMHPMASADFQLSQSESTACTEEPVHLSALACCVQFHLKPLKIVCCPPIPLVCPAFSILRRKKFTTVPAMPGWLEAECWWLVYVTSRRFPCFDIPALNTTYHCKCRVMHWPFLLRLLF